MVTPDAPVNDVKNAQTITAMIAAPPRKVPNQALNRLTSRCAAPPSARK